MPLIPGVFYEYWVVYISLRTINSLYTEYVYNKVAEFFEQISCKWNQVILAHLYKTAKISLEMVSKFVAK